MSIFQRSLFIILLGVFFLTPIRADEITDALQAGNNFFSLGQYEMAVMQYRIAAAWPGEHRAMTHFNIGVCYHRLNRKTEAVAEYRAAIDARHGQYWQASRALGMILEEMDKREEAKISFEAAVKFSEGRDAESLFQLALILSREGDRERALKNLQQAIKYAGKNFPGGHNNLGVLLAMKGQWKEALQEFDLARRQSKGKSNEAAHNFQICRSILLSSQGAVIAELQTVNQAQ